MALLSKNKYEPQHPVYMLGHGNHWKVPDGDYLHDLSLDTCTRSENVLLSPEVKPDMTGSEILTPEVPFYYSFDNFFDKYHIVPWLQVVLL